MGAAISLRADFDAEGLRRLARKSKHAAQARRLLALALIYGEARARMQRVLAMSPFRSCVTGSCGSMRMAPTG
ncbi:hypothetical protein J2W42_005138 [Rhizobium tibeticum]|nr:hypothetical protein [Rhizobium tibeticum]